MFFHNHLSICSIANTIAFMKAPVIAVVGSAMMDLSAYIAEIPKAGQTLKGDQFTTGFGGKGANQVVMAAISGANTYFIGCIGEDVFGDAIAENFKVRGVNTKYLQRGNLPTGVAHIWVETNGENRIIIIPGANHQIDSDSAIKAISEIPDLDIVIGQCEIKQEVTLAAFKAAKARGAITILNPAPFETLSADLIANCDWIIPNESEYAALGSIEANILLTLGEKGVRHLNTGVEVPSIKVNAVDTTGAGDSFVGAFAAKLATGELAAMQFGCIAAGLSVTKKGAQSSYPTYEEISTFS
jgi:ribokinase